MTDKLLYQQDEHGIVRHVEIRMRHAPLVVRVVLEHDGRTAMLQQIGRGRGDFQDGAVRGEIPAQHRDAAVGAHGIV